jgi:type I restriction enzyme S subunit
MIKCYEKYKQTKNFWYPEVPSHWLLSKVKYIAKTIAGGTPSTDKSEYWDNGDIPWLPSGKLQNCEITTAEKFITEEGLNNSSTKWIKSNTTLIALTGATCANIGFLRFQACANQSVVAIDEFQDKANSRFLFYMLISMRKQILTHQSGGAQAGINDGNVKNLFLVVPPLNEQLKISQYLDHQTAIIDQLIQQKEKLIVLLKEKRQSVINEAVTKGLNPNAKMKDSGIEWLGEVPESWELVKFNRYVFLKHGYQFRDYDFTDEGVKIVKITQLKADGSLDVSNASFIDINRISEFKEIIIEEGDILMALTGGTIGKIIKVEKVDEILLQNYRVGKFIPTSNRLSKDFLFWVLSSIQIQYQIFFAQKETGQPNIGKEDFGKMMFVLPPISEQSEIVQFIANSIKKISDLIRLIELEIVKLNDYRQSIISEAVTGKIDVRDWQPSKKQVI